MQKRVIYTLTSEEMQTAVENFLKLFKVETEWGQVELPIAPEEDGTYQVELEEKESNPKV
mgnify:CR=1 FL=1